MKIEIIQPEDNKTNYLERIAGFFTGKVTNKEQLESRFDALMTEFAMALRPVAHYDATKRILTIK